MGKLYCLGATLILIAVAYQYRREIQTFVQDRAYPSKRADISSNSEERTKPFTQPENEEDDNTVDPSNKADTQPDSGTSTSVNPSQNYYNPPFDPDNPPPPRYSKVGTRLITLNELAAHAHDGPLRPLWLAMMGRVYDVDKGAEHYYGPNGGYKFFTGRDGTRAFVTGEFNDEGLTDDISDLTALQLGEIEDWVKFYNKDYTFVGKLIGRFNDKNGSPTKEWYKFTKKLAEKEKIKAEQRELEKKYPGCNSKWSEAEGGLVYCSEKSGGVHRDWVGYPRRFFAPGTKQWRCACIHENDLNSPHIKPYPGCDNLLDSCKVDPKQLSEMRSKGL